jgi:hypothetical protein
LACAQSLDPRAYANAPVGLNFLVAGYSYSTGGVGFDPSVPPRDDRQSGSRLGFTFSLPLSRHYTVKLYANTGLYARTGTDFDTYGVAWQYLWGGGL